MEDVAKSQNVGQYCTVRQWEKVRKAGHRSASNTQCTAGDQAALRLRAGARWTFSADRPVPKPHIVQAMCVCVGKPLNFKTKAYVTFVRRMWILTSAPNGTAVLNVMGLDLHLSVHPSAFILKGILGGYTSDAVSPTSSDTTYEAYS